MSYKSLKQRTRRLLSGHGRPRKTEGHLSNGSRRCWFFFLLSFGTVRVSSAFAAAASGLATSTRKKEERELQIRHHRWGRPAVVEGSAACPAIHCQSLKVTRLRTEHTAWCERGKRHRSGHNYPPETGQGRRVRDSHTHPCNDPASPSKGVLPMRRIGVFRSTEETTAAQTPTHSTAQEQHGLVFAKLNSTQLPLRTKYQLILLAMVSLDGAVGQAPCIGI